MFGYAPYLHPLQVLRAVQLGQADPQDPVVHHDQLGQLGLSHPWRQNRWDQLTVSDRCITGAYSSDWTQYSQKHLSLLLVQEAPEDLVFQEVQQAQRYQIAPSHQESPWKVQCYNDVILALEHYSSTELHNYW